MYDLQQKKEELATKYRVNGYAASEDIVQAFLKVPREEFVLPEFLNQAYDDNPLPIMAKQTISAPHMCVLILSYCRLVASKHEPILKILEVGTGSGYQAALIAELLGDKGRVYTMERLDPVAEFAQQNLERTGYADSVTVACADGTEGWPEPDIPPFDRIIVTAAAPQIPPPLIEQLKIGGWFYMPRGNPGYQDWIEVEKVSDHELKERVLTAVSFVPLIGKYGLPE